MTYVEFFEKDMLDNICSCLSAPAERVVFIGDNTRKMRKCAQWYETVLSARGIKPEFVFRSINRNDLQVIVDALSSIVEEFRDCVFDLTGGEDLYLVAVGIIFQKYEGKIQMHRFNIQANTITGCGAYGENLNGKLPELSVGENIEIHGGCIKYISSGNADGTFLWNVDKDFKTDVDVMWGICRENVRLWNTQISVIEAAAKLYRLEDLSIDVPESELIEEMNKIGGMYIVNNTILTRLLRTGMLEEFCCKNGTVSIRFKNEQIRRCLTVAGRVLEMKIYCAALEASDKSETRVYNDVMNGVYIDWNGITDSESDKYGSENEIDIIAMHGMVPVFISCKNGYIEKEELYKLESVANRFGGKYAKKVLIATSLDDSDESNYFRQRASDMKIRLLEGFSHNGKYKKIVDMEDRDLNCMLRSLWSN